jgi:hypothetical protein
MDGGKEMTPETIVKLSGAAARGADAFTSIAESAKRFVDLLERIVGKVEEHLEKGRDGQPLRK